MPDALTPTPLPDLDSLVRPTHDEHARTRMVAQLHHHAMMRLRYQLRDVFDRSERPQFERTHGRGPETGREYAAAMKDNPFFQAYSAIRYNAQEMGPLSRQPAIERVLPELIETARETARRNPAGGSLRLDPDLAIPRYVSALDVHLAPGCYHSEFAADDVAQGVLLGTGISSNGSVDKKRNFGGVGPSVGTWVKHRFPDLKVRRVLDMATQSGKNLTPYAELFPGAELHGIDVAAPGLRYGHAKAETAGLPVHFSQQNAEATDFPDGHFDLIVSSFFLHEVTTAATKRILAECHRLLSPGGVLAHMELPPSKSVDAFQNFAFDWDTKNNNEPYYAGYRAQDPSALCVEAGFDPAAVFELTVPDVTSFDMTRYGEFLAGTLPSPQHGRGGWFVFGGRK